MTLCANGSARVFMAERVRLNKGEACLVIRRWMTFPSVIFLALSLYAVAGAHFCTLLRCTVRLLHVPRAPLTRRRRTNKSWGRGFTCHWPLLLTHSLIEVFTHWLVPPSVIELAQFWPPHLTHRNLQKSEVNLVSLPLLWLITQLERRRHAYIIVFQWKAHDQQQRSAAWLKVCFAHPNKRFLTWEFALSKDKAYTLSFCGTIWNPSQIERRGGVTSPSSFLVWQAQVPCERCTVEEEALRVEAASGCAWSNDAVAVWHVRHAFIALWQSWVE